MNIFSSKNTVNLLSKSTQQKIKFLLRAISSSSKFFPNFQIKCLSINQQFLRRPKKV